MALLKNKTLENGIVTQYHRIVSLNIIVNQTCIIEVASYINEDYRKEDVPSENLKIYLLIQHIIMSHIMKQCPLKKHMNI